MPVPARVETVTARGVAATVGVGEGDGEVEGLTLGVGLAPGLVLGLGEVPPAALGEVEGLGEPPDGVPEGLGLGDAEAVGVALGLAPPAAGEADAVGEVLDSGDLVVLVGVEALQASTNKAAASAVPRARRDMRAKTRARDRPAAAPWRKAPCRR
jgi:hypothetical protein